MLILSILKSLIMIFIMILPGVIFRKFTPMTMKNCDGINSFVVNLAWPCLVIDAMQIEFSMKILGDSLYIMVLCLILFAVLFVISFPFAKLIRLTKTKQYLTIFMLLFGNTGFIGIPVIKALYGTEALFYAAIMELVNDILLFTVGIACIQLSAGSEVKIRAKDLMSPGLIGVLVGLLLFLCRIEIPAVIALPIETIGTCTTPLAMFIIGFQLGGLSLKEILGDMQVYAVCFVKLIIVPLIALLMVKVWVGDIGLLEKVFILDFAMPVASAAAIYSQAYRGEQSFATKSVLLSTVISIVTISIFAVIIEL